MKMKKRMKAMSLLLAAAMLVTPMVTTTAFADRNLATWNTTVGSADKTWSFPSDTTGTISSAVSSNPSIVAVTTWTTTSVITNPIANGSATLTITYIDTTGATQTITQPITVGGSGASRTFSFTTIGSEQTDNQWLSSMGTVDSQNKSVATVALNTSGYMVVRAVGNGTTTITGNALGAGGASVPINYSVTVSAANSGVGGVGSINGTVITIPKGGTYTFPSAYQMSATSGNTSVVTAVPSGTTGSITYILNGIAAGETTVTMQKSTSLSANWESTTYTVKVTDGTTGSTVTGTSLQKMDLNAGGSRTYNSPYAEVDATSGKSDNESVAKVAITGKAVKVTGVSAGSANITFKARLQANGVWSDFTIPVTVAGTSSTSLTNNSSGGLAGSTSTGEETSDTSGKITFKKETYTLKKSGKQPYVIANGIKMGDDTVKANELLWISNNTSIVAVNAKTGQFKVLKTSGSARLIAVDPDGEYVGSVVIKAKA